jgi:signal transduction histidine kinase/PAS domain-containing protein/ActR/RegA family two-component response regulator
MATTEHLTTSIGDEGRYSRTRVIVRALGLYALIGGFVSFIGWAANVPRLTDWYNNGISIQPNTTVAVMCSGLAVLLLLRGDRRASAGLGVIIGFIGFTALVQYVVDSDFSRLNTLLMFGREWGRVGVVVPGRMGPPGALSWTLLGVALVLNSGLWPRLRSAVPRIAMATLAISALSIAGYLYGSSRLYSLPYVTVIALQTATFIVAVSLAIIASLPERAPTRWFLDTGPAGVVARQAVPLIIAFPILAGWLRLWGEKSGWYDTSFGTAMLVVVLIILLLSVLSWTVRTISQHETALRASERQMAVTLESITDGFVTLDRDWRFRFANAEAGRMLNRTPADFIGKKVSEVFPQSIDAPAFRALERAAKERVTVDSEDYVPVLRRWFAYRIYPSGDGDIAVYFQDVTDRKRVQEERTRDLVGLSRLQALSTKLVQRGDLQSLLSEILAAAADLTGTSKGNIQFYDHDAQRLSIFVHQGLGEEFVRHFANNGASQGCDLAAQTLVRVICADVEADPAWQGTENLRVLLADGIRGFQSTPLISREGRLLGVLSTHATSPYHPTERELRHLDLLARMAADFIERSQSEEALRDADRAKDEFLAMLAHELRSPLAPVQNAVHLLRIWADGDERLHTTTEMLTRQVTQLVRLVDDLVDVSRITRGKIDLVKQPVDVSTVVRQAIETVEPIVRAKRQELHVVMPSSPTVLEADATRLTQIVGNMLTNASKYSPVGGRVELTVVGAADGEIAIRVRDNGIGITPEHLPRIFDLFMQGDSSLERSAGGLGIGLTLVKTLVELHGGTITAYSDGRGKGSEFVVRLPATHEAGDNGTHARPSDMAGAVAPSRILIVDDNEDGANSLAAILSLSGHATYTAHDGEQAVEMAARHRPDVVLLDIGLPKLNGYEACRRIREQPWGREILLVAVTGWGADTYRQRSSEAGFDTHVVKPLDADTLARLLASRAMTPNPQSARSD